MIVRLLVSNDKANVKKVVLRSDTVIGRSSDCNLRIASQEVSRRHCSILLSERAVRVRDLGSANGTFLNGSQLEANIDVPAPPGSELEVGNVRFVISYDTPATADLEASTAEVPNAVLQARLAREAGDSGTAKPKLPGTVPRSDVFRSPGGKSNAGADSATDPDRSPADPDQTIDERGGRRVDDTLAMKEGVAEEAKSPEAQPASEVDETISMLPEEFNVDVAAAASEDESPAGETETPRKGWKSVFGMFGGKKQKPGEEPDSPADATERDDSQRLDPAPDRTPDPERNRKTVPEFTLPGHVDEEPADGTADEFELPPAEAAAADDTIQISADESVSPHSPRETTPESAADDTNLQDFFRQLSKE